MHKYVIQLVHVSKFKNELKKVTSKSFPKDRIKIQSRADSNLGGVDLCMHIVPSTSVHCTVYALTFTGLNFRGFRGSVAIRESFIPRKFRPVLQ